jgi:hypothetical protein
MSIPLGEEKMRTFAGYKEIGTKGGYQRRANGVVRHKVTGKYYPVIGNRILLAHPFDDRWAAREYVNMKEMENGD